MNKWYVIHVLSTHEKKVKKALSEQLAQHDMEGFIEEVVLPIEKLQEVKKGEQRIVEKRMWPGYLLVKMNLTDDSWQYVKNTSGVIGFLGGEHPTALSEEEVEEILRDLQEKKETVAHKHQFQMGDRVKVNDGVFVNFIGTVTEVFHDKGRLSVLVSIFGRDTRVDDLEFWQVEEITDDEEEGS